MDCIKVDTSIIRVLEDWEHSGKITREEAGALRDQIVAQIERERANATLLERAASQSAGM